MCLIIDANIAGQLFSSPETRAAFEPVMKALADGAAQAIYGGHLTVEYQRIAAFWRFVVALDRAGRARQLPAAEVQAETQRLKDSGRCRSNDHHVIALARVGEVRLLCSQDQPLHADFTDKALLDAPRGNVYQNAAHAHLIRKHCKHGRG